MMFLKCIAAGVAFFPLAALCGTLERYVERFNAEDEELYTNAIPNAAAAEFIRSGYGAAYLPPSPNIYKSKAGAQQAHESDASEESRRRYWRSRIMARTPRRAEISSSRTGRPGMRERTSFRRSSGESTITSGSRGTAGMRVSG